MTETTATMSSNNYRARAASISSNGTTSTTGNFSFVPRYTPKPDPAYISSTSAAEHVTRRHRHEAYDLISPAASPTNDDGDAAIFSENALSLLNAFLDSLLYNFLAKARGTSIHQLKPAIVEVLKHKLGREAIASADEELTGLVSEDDEDEEDGDDSLGHKRGPIRRPNSTSPEWHLESAFKRMRLRVMVFIRLGDFDDEDEERFLEEAGSANDFSSGASATGSTTPGTELGFQSSPAPVYLASVLEFLAEQILSLAGDAAFLRAKSRARANARRGMVSPTDDIGMEPNSAADPSSERVVVEEADVEKIALNPSFTRLWRTWLKNHRSILSPPTPVRSPSSASAYGPNGRRTSVTSPTPGATPNGKLAAAAAAATLAGGAIGVGVARHKHSASGTIMEDDGERDEESFHEAAEHLDGDDDEEIQDDKNAPPEGEPSETDIAANIPLPIGEKDVDEIEVPGIAPVIYDDGEQDEDEELELDEPEWVERPRSLSAVMAAPFIRLDGEPIPEDEAIVEEEPKEPTDEEKDEELIEEKDEMEADEASAVEEKIAFVKPPLKRQRSNSVPVQSTMPWDWIPLSIRRALKKLRTAPPLNDDELLELASGVPLPEDLEDEEFGEKRITPIPVAVETEKGVEEVTDTETKAEQDTNEANVVEAPESESKESEDRDIPDGVKMPPPPIPSKNDKRSPSPGVLAASAALAAATGVTAGAFAAKQNENRQSMLSTRSSKDLSVQTKEVFEPEDDASSRRSSNQIARPQAATEGEKITSNTSAADAAGAAAAAAAVAMMGVGVAGGFGAKQEKQKFQPSTALQESKKSPTMSEPVDSPQVADFDPKTAVKSQAQQPEQLKPAVEARQPKKTTSERPISMIDEVQPKAYKPQPKTDATQVEAKSAKPVVKQPISGTKAGAVAAAAAAISAATAAAASTNPSKKVEKQIAMERSQPVNISPVSTATKPDHDSPVSPVSLPAQPNKSSPPTSDPTSTQQQKSREGPPKPSLSGPNPYAMLYEDIEPDMIGVAKTSNVPIHATKPPVPAEQRPWTPNRGVGSVTRSSTGSGTGTLVDAATVQKSSLSERAKNVPKPLRTSSAENVTQGAQVPRTVVSKAPVVDGETGDKQVSVDPDRLNGGQIVTLPGSVWRGEKPKESPIIPRFFQNEQSSTTTSTTPSTVQTPSVNSQEKTTVNGVTAAKTEVNKHSPKGSQGSNKDKELDPEAKAKEEKFDALLRQQEPMKYTLTPEEIRDVGPPYAANKTSLDKKAPPTINTAASNIKAAATSVIAGPKSPGLFRKKETPPPQTTQPPIEKPQPITPAVSKAQPASQAQQKKPAKQTQEAQRPLTIGEIRKAIAALSPEPTGEPRRRSGLLAREARVPGGEMGDFVDWIRTTGPNGAPVANGNSVGRANSVGTRPIARAAVGRSAMVPREPGMRGGESADLAEFIRNGPDGATGKNKPLPSGPTRAKSPGPSAGLGGGPIRKNRVRPKDPYAIDLSDDEDFDLKDDVPVRAASPPSASTAGIVAPIARRASPGPTRTLSSSALNTLNVNAPTSRSVSPAPGAVNGQNIQRSASSLSNRNSHPALSGGLIQTPGSNTMRKLKLEARPAGATRGFGGHGYYYSTTDMADFLRTSGPDDEFASRATTANGHANGGPNGFGGRPGDNHGSRGLSRGGLGEFEYTMWRD